MAKKASAPSAVITGGSTNGASPRNSTARATREARRQRNQASGSATETASAAEAAASPRDASVAARQPGSLQIAAYQSSEKPSGGNARLRRSLTETPATIASGAARNPPTAASPARRSHR